jgi:hypothetical protein
LDAKIKMRKRSRKLDWNVEKITLADFSLKKLITSKSQIFSYTSMTPKNREFLEHSF